MTFQVDRHDDRPRREVGVRAQPQDRLGRSRPRSSRARLMSPNGRVNSQYHRRLETPRPMTTGTKMIGPRDPAERGVRGHQQRQQVAADHQDRGDEQRVLERVAERHPELLVGERPGEVVDPDELGRRDQRPVVERDPEHLDERVGGEGQHEEQRRRQVQQPDQLVAPSSRTCPISRRFAWIGRDATAWDDRSRREESEGPRRLERSAAATGRRKDGRQPTRRRSAFIASCRRR